MTAITEHMNVLRRAPRMAACRDRNGGKASHPALSTLRGRCLAGPWATRPADYLQPRPHQASEAPTAQESQLFGECLSLPGTAPWGLRECAREAGPFGTAVGATVSRRLEGRSVSTARARPGLLMFEWTQGNHYF